MWKFKQAVRGNSLLFLFVRTARKLRITTAWLVKARTIRAYLESHEVPKLQIGSGQNVMKGWLNTDALPKASGVIFLDASKPFAFEDSIFNHVYSEHQIEQLPYQKGIFMLRECYRILKPGGRIRIATPGLETLMALATPEKTALQEQYIKWISDLCLPDLGVYKESIVINNAFHNWGHQFIYDAATLQSSLEEAGFINVTQFSSGESETTDLQGIESHGQAVGNEEMTRFETMVLEGTRPLSTLG